MANPAERFTSRVQTYAKYRPSYPAEVIELLRSECGLTPTALVADVGSGTGLLTELLLKNGNEVFGVEPNEAMRAAGVHLLSGYPNFRSVAGSAEATTLPAARMDLITAGQAFHWFDTAAARTEFARILKPRGFVALIWNDRRLDSTSFLRSYEQLLNEFGTDYAKVQEFDPRNEVDKFFAPAGFKLKSFINRQDFDLSALKGRVFSASYTPEPGHPKYEGMVRALEAIFEAHEESGTVSFEYDTRVYYGQLV